MAHITEFKIEGLLGRQEPIAMQLDRHTNVFFGSNGAGKTSLLKILAAACSADLELLTRVPFGQADVSIYVQTHDRVLRRNIVRAHAKQESELAEEAESPASAVTA